MLSQWLLDPNLLWRLLSNACWMLNCEPAALLQICGLQHLRHAIARPTGPLLLLLQLLLLCLLLQLLLLSLLLLLLLNLSLIHI